MGKLTKGAACIDAGGIYISLMPFCERIELIGALRAGASEIEAIEFLVVPKWSPPLLGAALEKEFGPLISCSDSEIIYNYYDTKVELTLTTRDQWESVLRALREAA